MEQAKGTNAREASPRIVGGFTLIGLALIVAGSAGLAAGRLFEAHRTFVVFFPKPVGIKEGAPVTFRQTPIGQVREVELVLTGRGVHSEIKVVIDLRKRALRNLGDQAYVAGLSDADFAATLVASGLRAGVRSTSPLAGQKFLDFDFHPELPARFARIPMPFPELPTAPTSMEILRDKVDAAIGKIADVPLDEVLLQIQATLASAQRLLDGRDLAGALKHLRRGLETADRTLSRADQTLGTLDEAVANVRTTLASADATMKGLDKTLAHLDRTLATVDRNVERTADTQYEMARNLDEMNQVLRSIRELVDTLQRNPEALLKGKPAPKAKE